jgi:hypothetical protein
MNYEVHSTHTYIGKGLGLVYRNTTNLGDPCPLHKKPKGGGRPAIKPGAPQTPKAQQGLYTDSLTHTMHVWAVKRSYWDLCLRSVLVKSIQIDFVVGSER